MSIQVDVPAVMRNLTDGNKKISAEGGNVSELIDNVEQSYPGLKERLMSDGELNRYVNIFVNEDDIRFTGLLDTTVKEGDVVTILPAVAGG